MPSFTRNQMLAAYVIVAAALVGTCILLLKPHSRMDYGSAPVRFIQPEEQQGATVQGAGEEPRPETMIGVHVTGKVRQPGVYELKPGSRVIDAVRSAGGGLPNADLQTINLAKRLADGDQVFIAAKGTVRPPDKSVVIGSPATASGGSSNSEPETKMESGIRKLKAPGEGTVNINTADLNQLQQLPGVGPTTAQRIMDFRTKQGKFQSLDDLNEIEGIGDVKIERMKPFVKF